MVQIGVNVNLNLSDVEQKGWNMFESRGRLGRVNLAVASTFSR